MRYKTTLAILLAFVIAACTATTNAEEPVNYKNRVYEPELFTPVVIATPTPTPTVEPTVKPTPKTTPKPKRVVKFYKTIKGTASTYGPGYAGYLALPEGRGIKVEVCGAGGCIIRISNDAGPNKAMQRKGRVIDLNVNDFEAVCGCSWTTGLIKVRVRYVSE